MNGSESNSWLVRLDYLFVLRPMLFFPGWTTLLAGFFINDKSRLYTFYLLPGEIDYLLLLRLMLGFAMMMGAAFVLNQISDVESDRRNNKLYLIADGHVSRRLVLIEAILLVVIGLLLGFSCGIDIGIVFVAFFVLTGIMYNFPPFSLKDRPWWSLWSNMLMGFMAFAAGWLGQNEYHPLLWLESIPYVLFNTTLYLYTTFPDIEGDRTAGKKTLAVRYGYEKLMVVAFIVYACGFVSIFWLQDMQAFSFHLMSMAWFIKGMFTLEIPEAVKTTKYGILWFSLSISLKWPLYFLLMIIGFFGTKTYFRRRFYLDYPNFSGT